MSSIRKDPQRPKIDGDLPEAINDTGAGGGPIDKTNVMKSFYQRELEERDAEIERLSQDNQRLRAKIITGEDGGDFNQDMDSGQPVDLAAQRRTAEVNAQLIATFNEEHDKLAGEAADAKDRMLRALAELDNVRRRTEREKADISKYAISEFARDVIGLGDDVQRAIDHVPADAAANDPVLRSFLEGVQLTERELLATLERHGVVRLSPQGERFDPNKHQAVMEQDNAEVPAGTVVQVLQAGYMIGERTLRPAVVVVSKGGAKIPKPAPTEETAAPAAEEPPT
jgi:molecular chaperone GrpE